MGIFKLPARRHAASQTNPVSCEKWHTHSRDSSHGASANLLLSLDP